MSAPVLTPQANALIDQAIENILANPRHFDMSTFVCGSVGCIGGQIGFAAGYHDQNISTEGMAERFGIPIPFWEGRPSPFIHIGDFAALILGATLHESGYVSGDVEAMLFYADDLWPKQFCLPYKQAAETADFETMAKIAVARLQHYRATGE